jgi:hypothetical protein
MSMGEWLIFQNCTGLPTLFMECYSLLSFLNSCFWFLNLVRVIPEGLPLSAYNQGFFHTPTDLNPFCQKGTVHNFSWTRDSDFLCMVVVKADTMLSYSSTTAERNLVHNLQWRLWPYLRYIMRHGPGVIQVQNHMMSLLHGELLCE